MGYRLNNPRQGGLVGVDHAATGIPAEEAYVRAYCERRGIAFPIADWDFYIAFAVFRLAAISQGVYKRGLDGNASSENAASFNLCGFLSDAAARMVKIR